MTAGRLGPVISNNGTGGVPPYLGGAAIVAGSAHWLGAAGTDLPARAAEPAIDP
jgi:hypothetical protein